jgi:hypothetical protein
LIQKYDPTTDLAPDRHTGLPIWSQQALADKPEQVAAIADYFAARREDG